MKKDKTPDVVTTVCRAYFSFMKNSLFSFRKYSSLGSNVVMGIFFFLTSIYVKILFGHHLNLKRFGWLDALVVSALFVLTIFALIYFVFSVPEMIKLKHYENRFNLCHITNGQGEVPVLISAVADGRHREKLIFKANGVSPDEFETKRKNIASAFGKLVSSIEIGKNRSFIELTLSEKEIPKHVSFESIKDQKLKPLSFFVGESLDGLVSEKLSDLPHLLISGTSGGGKSNFFRQCLVSILKTTPYIQLYLLDLKMGIEVVEFSDLACVKIAKDEVTAVQYLKMIELEMKKRFEYLEKMKKKKIDPMDSPFDIIVVAVDEASVLFGKERAGSHKKDLIDSARMSLESLAKLSRAAGIHLVLATQKAVKDAIDTKVLENLQGRMVFKMMSTQGSTVALGNKRAQDLDNIKGRGIWQNGTLEVEVQTPFLDDEYLLNELKWVSEQYQTGERKLRGDLIALKDKELNEQEIVLNQSLEGS